MVEAGAMRSQATIAARRESPGQQGRLACPAPRQSSAPKLRAKAQRRILVGTNLASLYYALQNIEAGWSVALGHVEP